MLGCIGIQATLYPGKRLGVLTRQHALLRSREHCVLECDGVAMQVLELLQVLTLLPKQATL